MTLSAIVSSVKSSAMSFSLVILSMASKPFKYGVPVTVLSPRLPCAMLTGSVSSLARSVSSASPPSLRFPALALGSASHALALGSPSSARLWGGSLPSASPALALGSPFPARLWGGSLSSACPAFALGLPSPARLWGGALPS